MYLMSNMILSWYAKLKMPKYFDKMLLKLSS